MHDFTKLTQGEIADKLSILELKAEHGFPVTDEMESLAEAYEGPQSGLEALRRINAEAWEFVGIIHGHFDGVATVADDIIIAACRKAHLLNRQRVEAKNRINAECGDAHEYKSWKRAA